MNITPIVTKTKITSNVLLRDISRRSSLNRMYERQTLELLKKSIEERKKTYSALSKRDKEGGGLLGNLLTGSLLLKRLKGRGPKGPGGIGPGGGIRPKLPKGGGTIGGGVGRFGRFGRIGPLAILGTGLDFGGRLGAGQNLAQATIGAGGGLAGLVAGGKVGAAIGTAILPGVGTFAGGLIGSTIGAIAGGNIADTLTGVNSNTRRRSTIAILDKGRDKTLFSGALDQFDGTLKTLETDTAPTLMAFKKFGTSVGGGVSSPTPKTKFWTAGRIADVVFLTLELALLAGAIAFPGDAVAGDLAAAGLVARRLAKLRLLRKSSKFLSFSKTATDITKKAKQAQNARILFKRSLKTRILTQQSISKTSKTTKFFRDTKNIDQFLDRRFLDSLPGMSRVGKIRRQGANELLQTRISNILADIRKPKSVLFPERVQGFSNQGVLRQFTKGPLRSNVIRRNRFRPDPRLSDIIDDTEGLSRITIDQIKQNIKNTPQGADPKILEQILGGLRREGKTKSKIGDLIINPGKKFGTGGGKVNPAEVFNRYKQLDLFKPRAEGGRVEAGTPYMVGELGKELFVPDVSGDIIPNDKLGPAIIAMTKDADTIIVPQGGGSGGSSRTTILKADPYDVVAKYAQMTGLFTV